MVAGTATGLSKRADVQLESGCAVAAKSCYVENSVVQKSLGVDVLAGRLYEGDGDIFARCGLCL